MMFYVYAWLDPRKPGEYIYDDYSFNYEPYYIGKGKKHRKTERCNRNTFTINKLNKIQRKKFKNRVYVVKGNLSENGAFGLECKLISLIGRFDLGTGPLTNMSDGGEGNSGHRHTEENLRKFRERSPWNKGIPASDEVKKHLSEINKGKRLSEETKAKIAKVMKGRKLSKEAIEKTRKANIGRKCSEETKKLFSKMRKGKPNGRLGCKHTEGTKRKMSKIAKKRKRAKHSDETKGKISLSKRGDKNPMYGKQVSKETRLKLSKALKGQKRSMETRRRMSESKMGSKNPMWKGGAI